MTTRTTTTSDSAKQNDSGDRVICQGCQHEFPSRNSLFNHLKDTKATCLSDEDYQEYLEYVQSRERVRTVILYGYVPSRQSLPHGDDVADLLMEIMYEGIQPRERKYHRSYGHAARNQEALRQDNLSGALTELISTKLPPLMKQTPDEWVDIMNRRLQKHLAQDPIAQVRVFGRIEMESKRFHAEHDVTHRRMEYVLPTDFFYTDPGMSRHEFDRQFPPFSAGYKECRQETRPDDETRCYLLSLKRLMQPMCTGIVVIKPSDKAAAMEKEFHRKKRTRQIRQLKLDKDKNPALEAERSEGVNNDNGQEDVQNVLEEVPETKPKATRVLKRRRFHNFTPRVMAHEYLAYRRLDRFYHRATILARDRTFFKLGLTGDMFLNGQAPRIVGLFIALARGVIEPDFIDCIFDEDFPPLVPAPAAPTFALFAGEANYMLSEGKSKTILSPRNTKQYEHGFNDEKIILRVTEWEKVMHEAMADAWIRQGVDEDGRLAAERQWITQILEPWGINAQKQLIEYRQWKAASKLSPTLDSLEKSVPKIFDAVLYYLREASASGKWPSTTPKRQLVMVSTPQDEEACKNAAASLNIAYSKAKANKVDRSDAYGLEEGQGGASGSFSVGFMPGEQQPKSNELFPELTRAAFELERALMPEREPSSTIAINRNAQFRPHTDSGAGAGQSTSLIVGLGNYIGGELVVEGVKKDIHYKAIEFNGWTQRHWTMPFQGERYSLVWFTPKGCEGIRGIELCK